MPGPLSEETRHLLNTADRAIEEARNLIEQARGLRATGAPKKLPVYTAESELLNEKPTPIKPPLEGDT
jgi:hypothetical protein